MTQRAGPARACTRGDAAMEGARPEMEPGTEQIHFPTQNKRTWP